MDLTKPLLNVQEEAVNLATREEADVDSANRLCCNPDERASNLAPLPPFSSFLSASLLPRPMMVFSNWSTTFSLPTVCSYREEYTVQSHVTDNPVSPAPFDNAVNDYTFPRLSAFQPVAASNPDPAPRSVVNVETIFRMQPQDHNGYMVPGVGFNAQGISGTGTIQPGSANLSPPLVPPAMSPLQYPDAVYQRQDQSLLHTQRVVSDLRDQVLELQLQVTDIESELRTRYHREQVLNVKLDDLSRRISSSARFDGQGTQIDAQTSGRGLQNVGRHRDSKPSGSATNPPGCSGPSQSKVRMVPITSLSVENEISSPISISSELETSSSSYFFENTSSDAEGSQSPSLLNQGDSSRKRRRFPSSSSNAEETDNSEFPASHPFKRSRHIAMPPQVPQNYCKACYEKKITRNPSSFCFSCRSRMSLLRDAYLDDDTIELPRCSHLMGNPKRRCAGCIFKVYLYRHNLQFPSNPLPFPVTF